MTVMVDTLNRGGGRLVLRDASPSLEKARACAKNSVLSSSKATDSFNDDGLTTYLQTITCNLF